MKIFVAALICSLLLAVETIELKAKPSLEDKIYNGISNQVVSHTLLKKSTNLQLLIVQLVNPNLKPFCSGVRITPYLVIVSGSCIKLYENTTYCGGNYVRFQGQNYYILKCETRFETTDLKDEDYGRDHYNDIGILYVNFGWGSHNVNLLSNLKEGFSEGDVAYLLGWQEKIPKVILFQITEIGRRCLNQKPKYFDTNKIFCGKVLGHGQLDKTDAGSPLFYNDWLIGFISGRFSGYGRKNEIVFSSIFGHLEYIKSAIKNSFLPPFIAYDFPCILETPTLIKYLR